MLPGGAACPCRRQQVIHGPRRTRPARCHFHVPELHLVAGNLGARQWHHSQMLPGGAACPCRRQQVVHGPRRTRPARCRFHAPWQTPRSSGSSPAQAPQARASNATSQHRWGGGLPQTHPAALRSGMRMRFETPEQRHPTSHPSTGGRGHKFETGLSESADPGRPANAETDSSSFDWGGPDWIAVSNYIHITAAALRLQHCNGSEKPGLDINRL
jgi:hypothetical protein